MADEIDTRVSLDLDPEVVLATIEDYDDDTASYLSPAKAAFTEGYNALRAIHNAKAAAAEDLSMNDVGRLLKVDDYASKLMVGKVYPLWDTALATLTSKVAAWDKEMSKEVESKASERVSTEIRSHIFAMKPGERMSAISKAIKDGDDVVASAALGAPALLIGLDEDMKQILLREYHDKFNPAMAKRYRAAKSGLAQIEGKIGLLRSELTKAVGVYEESTEDRQGRRIVTKRLTPGQLREMKGKSDAPFAVGL
jgi:hypothetical protein